MKKIVIYDTTLRDGSQAEGISYSKTDKLRIAKRLDALGVSYIEGGWPGSNPTDMGFFKEAKAMNFKNAKLAAFGSTRRAIHTADKDPNLLTLLEAETPVVTIFGKSWLLHVKEVLRITPEQNLEIIEDSCAFLKSHDKEVIYDAEHFYDGYVDNPEYALDTLKAAVKAGASTVVLCDTNGGTLPKDIAIITTHVRDTFSEETSIGIHTHNDGGMGVANSIIGVDNGVTHIQGTINGFGERCGNANLCAIIPTLELKYGIPVIAPGQLAHLKDLGNFICDVANLRPDKRQPYIGDSVFAHKGGMHVNAMQKITTSFEHIEPKLVGNRRRYLVSDLSGKSNILIKAAEHNVDFEAGGKEADEILAELKKLEGEGYEFEAAGASFHLMMQKVMKKHKPAFELDGFRVIVEKRGHNDTCTSLATVKIKVNGESEITAAESLDGPVNALDQALRKSLRRFYPEISDFTLRDYKVRILEGDAGTSAKTRVLIDSTNKSKNKSWGTVGVSTDLIEASWEALVDSIEYPLYNRNNK